MILYTVVYLLKLNTTVCSLATVAKFGILCFLLKIKIIMKEKHQFTTNPAIAQNRCWWQL